MNQLVALDNKVAAKVVPKPTKNELIQALAVRRYEQLKQEITERAAEFEKLKTELSKEVLAVYQEKGGKQTPSVDLGYDNGIRIVNVHVSCSEVLDGLLPQGLMNKILRYHTLRKTRQRLPDFSTVKAEVRAALVGHTGGDRVGKMLEDSGVVKAMDAALKQMFDPKPKESAAQVV